MAVQPLCRAVRRVSVVLVMAAYAGCDYRDATAPSAEHDSVHLFPVFSEVPVGSYSIPIPPFNHPSNGAVAWHSTEIVVPDSGWIRVRVQGGIQVTANPEYVDNYQGETPYDGVLAGARGIPGTGYLRVSVRVDGANRALNVLDGDSLNTGFVAFAPGGALIEVSRSGVPGGGSCTSNTYSCPGGTNYHHAPAYLLDGLQTLTVDVLPDGAVGVRALETHVARWDTVAFRAYTSPEVTTSLQWHFRVNDTLPEPFYPNLGTGNVSACLGQLSCNHSVPGNGRMYVWGLTATNYARAASQIVWVDRPLAQELTVSCSPQQVPAGAQTDCEAGATPGPDEPQVQEWFFVPEAPQGHAGFSTVCGAGPACSMTVYQSGTVYARAVLSGVEQTAGAGIGVGLPSFVLTCPGSVLRGLDIGCHVSSTMPLTSIDWRFVPDLVVIHPRRDTLGFAAGNEVSWSGPSPWNGKLVVPGFVHAQATYADTVLADSGHIAVQPRSGPAWTLAASWAGEIQYGAWGEAPMDSAGIWVRGRRLGENLRIGDLSDSWEHVLSGSVATVSLDTIGSGPNQGFAYVTGHAYVLERAMRINRYFNADGPADVVVGGQLLNRWHALIAEGAGDPSAFRAGIVAHEAYGYIGHQRGFEEGIQGDVCGNLALRLERIVGTPAKVADEVLAAHGLAVHHIGLSGGHHRVHSHLVHAPFIQLRMQGLEAFVHHKTDDPKSEPTPQPSVYLNCEHELVGIP
jgi:hypothetical protein